jgi:lambda family phage portal protein
MNEISAIERAKASAEIAKLRLDAFKHRQALRQLKRAYDAATPSTYHPKRGDKRSPDAVMSHAGTRLREVARYLDENSDLAIGILDDLVNKIVGCGIGWEPMAKLANGKLATRANESIRAALADLTAGGFDSRREFTWGESQRQIARTWLRDGEVLIKHIEGTSSAIIHRNAIPYSLELLEPDYLPFDLFGEDASLGTRIVHGVELNGWGEPIRYHLYRQHPGDSFFSRSLKRDTAPVPARAITHLKFSRRIGQTRGVSVFHGVLHRMQDLKDYDESELIGARVASSFTVAITRATDFNGAIDSQTGARKFELAPGMILDGLLPGEGIETIGSNRPNSAFQAFRQENVRGLASGTGTSNSSISKNYAGSYSAQRQEMTEQDVAYSKLREYFIGRFIREIYRRAIDLGVLAGVIDLRGVTPASRYAFEPIEPATPWIDPLKEMKADELAIKIGVRSRHQVIRARGGDPAETDQQIAVDTFVAQAPAPVPAAPPAPDDQSIDDRAA